ncbi:MAG: hypothetical protein AAFY56_10455 [Pseudomonadota bacterium]
MTAVNGRIQQPRRFEIGWPPLTQSSRSQFNFNEGTAVRFLDADGKSGVRNLQLYLTPKEAEELVKQLSNLLSEPEANEHFHLLSTDGGWELSCSLITERKLAEGRYTKHEQAVLRGHKFK